MAGRGRVVCLIISNGNRARGARASIIRHLDYPPILSEIIKVFSRRDRESVYYRFRYSLLPLPPLPTANQRNYNRTPYNLDG